MRWSRSHAPTPFACSAVQFILQEIALSGAKHLPRRICMPECIAGWVIYRRLADSLRALVCLSLVDATERNTLRPQINRHNARFSEKEEEVQL